MKNIVITGASRGIGLALTKAYLAAGDRVYAWCRNPAGAVHLQALAPEAGDALVLIDAEIGDLQSIDAAAAQMGDTPIDVLLNVAGFYHMKSSLADEDFDGWYDSFRVMVVGPFHTAQKLLPNLEKAKGKIVTVSTQMAASTWAYGNSYAYVAAKAAVNRVMRSLAIDIKDRGIAVAIVHPGLVKTDMGGPNAEITPEESASGIKAVAENLTMGESGEFFKWNGERHPW